MVSALLAFFCAVVLVLLLGPAAIPRLARLSARARVREDTPERHRAKQGTPSMGGLFLIPAAALAALLFARSAASLLALPFVFLSAALGLADDLVKTTSDRGRGLRARAKLLAQFLLGFAAVACARLVLARADSIPLPLGYEIPNPGPWLYLLGGLVFAGACNAVNLTDGLDGLAAGAAVPVFVAFAAVLVLSGQPALAAFSAAFAGAAAAFLLFNHHPARVWMGDTGSQALGGALAVVALFSGLEWLLFCAGLVFVAEALSVAIQVIFFQTTGRRVFRMSPVHHHFELLGCSEPRIVAGFWAASAFCAAVAFCLALAGGITPPG